MRRIILATLMFAISALAVDVSGRWWGDAVSEGQSHPVYITLIQEGNTLKGTGGPSPREQDLLTNGKIQGNRITFDVVPGGTSPLHFELSTNSVGLTGTVKVRHNGQIVTGQVSLRKRSS
jgi:hypothetical protein